MCEMVEFYLEFPNHELSTSNRRQKSDEMCMCGDSTIKPSQSWNMLELLKLDRCLSSVVLSRQAHPNRNLEDNVDGGWAPVDWLAHEKRFVTPSTVGISAWKGWHTINWSMTLFRESYRILVVLDKNRWDLGKPSWIFNQGQIFTHERSSFHFVSAKLRVVSLAFP